MRSLPEKPRVVRHPLPHPRRAQIPVQGRPTVQILVLVGRPVLGLVVRPRCFFQGNDLLVPLLRFPVVGVEDQLPSGVVLVWVSIEGAVDDYDGVDTAVAPIGEHLVGLGPSGCTVVRDPLAFVPGAAVDVDGLGGEAHDGECLWAAAVSPHLDEERGCIAVGGEETLVWVELGLGLGAGGMELLVVGVLGCC